MRVSCIKTQVLWISGKMHVSFVKNLQLEFLLKYMSIFVYKYICQNVEVLFLLQVGRRGGE